jgi:hypothetical protein
MRSLFLVERSVTVFLLSLISKHEMLRMGLIMADGKFTYRQTASAADAKSCKD